MTACDVILCILIGMAGGAIPLAFLDWRRR